MFSDGDKKDTHNDFFNPTEGTFKLIQILLDSLHDGIVIIDENSIVKFVSKRIEAIWKIERGNILGRLITECKPNSMLPTVIRTKTPIIGYVTQQDGREYLLNITPLFLNGEIAGGISVVRDMTEINQISKELTRSRIELNRLRSHVQSIYRASYTFGDIIFASETMAYVIKTANMAATNELDVLITGESGTGKELVAQAIHNASPRSHKPFVAINCASIPADLLESELFGYEEGAFTGAKKAGKVGLFELANYGTIFLDEIGDMPLTLQPKLLRALEQRAIRRVGGLSEIPINIRIISATNKKMEDLLNHQLFRNDLYYRLCTIPISIPPLRHRKEDILVLINHFLQEYSQKHLMQVELEKTAINTLLNYDWPGNVRELKNTLDYAINVMLSTIDKTAQSPVIRCEHFPPIVCRNRQKNLVATPQKADKEMVQNALAKHGTSVEGKRQAAKELGVSLATLYNRIKEFQL